VRLFEGLVKTDYQDVLRAVGRYVDQQGFRDVRIIETEDGLILQGNVAGKQGSTKKPKEAEEAGKLFADHQRSGEDEKGRLLQARS